MVDMLMAHNAYGEVLLYYVGKSLLLRILTVVSLSINNTIIYAMKNTGFGSLWVALCHGAESFGFQIFSNMVTSVPLDASSLRHSLLSQEQGRSWQAPGILYFPRSRLVWHVFLRKNIKEKRKSPACGGH